MSEFFESEGDFLTWSPAASEIFSYRDEHAELGGFAFLRGGISDNNCSTYAVFERAAVSGWGREELTISASHSSEGQWSLTHKVAKKE